MHFGKLDTEYRLGQVRRVVQDVQRLLGRGAAPTAGRVVPDDDSLVIGTGRGLRLAVLFLDISGFSMRPSGNFTEQHTILQILNIFFSEMVRVAADYGGKVEKNTGDGLMVYFEHEGGLRGVSASQRAVAAAMTMMYANDIIITPVLTALDLQPITFRIGIDYGPVTVARLGVARQFNANVAIGTAANCASKILARAAAGDVVVGEAVALALPKEWWQWLRDPSPSGFVYVVSGEPYPLYRYTGRWI